jgi:predicted XRE-type DNA-binding protein
VGKRLTLRERFEQKVDRSSADGCHLFQAGAQTRSGHRMIWNQGRMHLAHRIAWELERGPIPEGICVLHRCDNPPCVRVDHLFLGTVGDNNADRDAKGRQVALRGEEHGSAKLTEEQVAAIRELASADVPQALIARAVGVSQSHVSLLHRGESRTTEAQRDRLAKVVWPDREAVAAS